MASTASLHWRSFGWDYHGFPFLLLLIQSERTTMAPRFLKGIADRITGTSFDGSATTRRHDLGQTSSPRRSTAPVAEQHYKLGGLATWFYAPAATTFDVSLHGFPTQIKSCRRYWKPPIIGHRSCQADQHPFRPTLNSPLTTSFRIGRRFHPVVMTKSGSKEATVAEVFDTAARMKTLRRPIDTTRQLLTVFSAGS